MYVPSSSRVLARTGAFVWIHCMSLKVRALLEALPGRDIKKLHTSRELGGSYV